MIVDIMKKKKRVLHIENQLDLDQKEWNFFTRNKF